MLNTCMNHIPELLCAGIALSLFTEHNNPCKVALCRWINGGGPWRPNLPSDSLYSLTVGLLGQTAKCFMGKVGLAVCGFLACPLGFLQFSTLSFTFFCAFEWSFRTCLISGSLDGSSDPNKLGWLVTWFTRIKVTTFQLSRSRMGIGQRSAFS